MAEPVPRPSGSPRYVDLVGVSLAVVILDQAVKALVTSRLEGRAPISLFGGAVFLEYARNTGAAFSLLPGGGVIFALVAVLVSVGILVIFGRLAHPSVLIRLGMALLLGGALGNLIDRVKLGYVVDFIDLRWWPVFNLADSAVVIGVALLVLNSALTPDRGSRP